MGASDPATSAGELEAKLRLGIETFNSGDYEAALGFFHSDAVIDSSAAFVVHGPYEGIEGVREFYGTIAGAFEEFRVEPEEIRIRGDRALVIAKTRGRLRGSEDMIVNDEFDLWTLRDGKAARLEIFFDRGEAEAALAVDETATAQ